MHFLLIGFTGAFFFLTLKTVVFLVFALPMKTMGDNSQQVASS
jgi:hypothetical protein